MKLGLLAHSKGIDKALTGLSFEKSRNHNGREYSIKVYKLEEVVTSVPEGTVRFCGYTAKVTSRPKLEKIFLDYAGRTIRDGTIAWTC